MWNICEREACHSCRWFRTYVEASDQVIHDDFREDDLTLKR